MLTTWRRVSFGLGSDGPGDEATVRVSLADGTTLLEGSAGALRLAGDALLSVPATDTHVVVRVSRAGAVRTIEVPIDEDGRAVLSGGAP